jgi:hypothetical protein
METIINYIKNNKIFCAFVALFIIGGLCDVLCGQPILNWLINKITGK